MLPYSPSPVKAVIDVDHIIIVYVLPPSGSNTAPAYPARIGVASFSAFDTEKVFVGKLETFIPAT